jgi:hypothetical protein
MRRVITMMVSMPQAAAVPGPLAGQPPDHDPGTGRQYVGRAPRGQYRRWRQIAEARRNRIAPRACHGAGQIQTGKTELQVLRRGQGRNRSPAALSASAPCQFNRKGARELGRHAAGSLTQSSDVAHFRSDHFSENPSFGTVCGPNSMSLAPELRAADAH